MASVVLLGTLDAKGKEDAFLRDRVRALGIDVILVDAGVRGDRAPADVSADEVAAAAGVSRSDLVRAGDRGRAIDAMARGATETVRRLHADGKLDGIPGLGGPGVRRLSRRRSLSGSTLMTAPGHQRQSVNREGCAR